MLNRCSFILIGVLFLFSVKAQVQSHLKIDSVNSSYDEHSPALSPDGETLYFTRSGHAANVGGVIDRGDIWFSTKTESGWSKAQHAGNVINHPGLNGVVGFSADGNRMYLLNYFDADGQGGGSMRNGIAVSTKLNGEWQKPERLQIQYFSNNSPYLGATINAEENTLILAMRSYLSEGNEDLYVSFKQGDDTWSQPQTLGNVVNTYGEEWSPFLAADNETLYFTSNAHDGLGGRDIFVTKRLNGSWQDWSTPVNLGEGINTKGTERDYFIPASGDVAFFSSTQNSEGFGDLFNYALSDAEKALQESIEEVLAQEEEAEMPIENEKTSVVVMTFQVLDKRTETPVDASVKMSYDGKDIDINTADIDSQNKHFVMSLEEGASVEVSIAAEGFLKYQETFTAGSSVQSMSDEFGGSSIETFYLTPEEVGTKVKIENVLFNRASANFSNPEVAKRQLDEIVQMMESNPGMAIRLEGHTDNRGDARLLKELSVERVKTVRDYLLSKGVAAERVEFEGFGGEKPLTDNDSASGREINRRVEFVIIR